MERTKLPKLEKRQSIVPLVANPIPEKGQLIVPLYAQRVSRPQ